jgi:hypothetical protein
MTHLNTKGAVGFLSFANDSSPPQKRNEAKHIIESAEASGNFIINLFFYFFSQFLTYKFSHTNSHLQILTYKFSFSNFHDTFKYKRSCGVFKFCK